MLKFARDEDTPTQHRGMVVRYRLKGAIYDGEISACRGGVMISGLFPLFNRADCLAFAEQLERAHVHHRHLADPHATETLTEADVDAAVAIGE